MPHFFINSKNKIENSIIINEPETYRHVARSLRSKVGEKLLLIDENQIQYETAIENISSNEIVCKIEKEYLSSRDLSFDLYLAQSPLRSDAQLTIMEKATELGVRGVYPVITDNCALAKSVLYKKHEKWQKVMFEASKQCERAKIPECYKPTTLESLLEQNFDKVLVLAERSTEITLKEYMTKNPINKGDKVLLIIGPEGGFSKEEIELLDKYNIKPTLLGDSILRTETASIVAISMIKYENM